MHENTPPGEFNPADHAACAICAKPRCDARRCRCDERVHPHCRTALDDQLAYLVPAARRMPLALIPGRGGGERVRGSRTAPLPLVLDPLSLTADGRTDEHLHVSDVYAPEMVSWTSVETVDTRGGPQEVTVHHHTPALDADGHRIMQATGDQSGMLPFDVWVRAWVLDWRVEFGHSAPTAPELRYVGEPRRTPAAVGPGWGASSATRGVLGAYLDAYRDAARRELAADLLGLGPAVTAGEREADGGEHDPHAREWGHRYGATPESVQLATDVGYLRTWLAHACDRYEDIAGFAASLRALHAAATRVLGDQDDREYLGRCPTGYRLPDGAVAGREWHDRESGEPGVCGAPLWQDPSTSVIACPRCHHEYGPREYLRLAGWIWRAWPIDRRRRYTLDQCNDIQAATLGQPTELRLPRCEHGRLVAVAWRDATEHGDFDMVNGRRVPRRMRAIAAVGCPSGCDTAAVEAVAA